MNRHILQTANHQLPKGFTLIETLAAITLLSVAIVAPMSLASRSLSASYYSRDQVTAYYLAQEAIESIRNIRDGNVLQIVQSSNPASINLFQDIPLDVNFTVDARKTNSITAINQNCSPACPALQTDGTLYGYNAGWTDTHFTRTVRVTQISGSPNELRVTVTVAWKTGAFQERSFSIAENMYRWIQDGT